MIAMDKDINTFGLSKRDWQTLMAVLQQFPEITAVKLFGSRATGAYAFGSDIDLAVLNPGVSDRTIRRLKAAFAESSLPYFVDVVHANTLQQPGLLQQIEAEGVLVYAPADQHTPLV